jgi:hypothetical protein
MNACAWNISVATSIGNAPIEQLFDSGWPGPNLRRPSTNNSAPTVVALPGAGAATVHRTLAQLRQYRSLAPGWDGGRAAAAQSASFDYAERFLALLSTWKVPMEVEAQIFSTGTAVLNVKSYNLDGQFEFLSNGTIAAVIDRGGHEWDADVENFDGKRIPDSIAQQLVAS